MARKPKYELHDKPEVFWTWELMPSDFVILGKVSLSRKDLAIECSTYGGWDSVPLQVLLQWRWDHDRDVLLREDAEAEACIEAERRKSAAKRKRMLGSLTLDELAGRDWFATWEIAPVAARSKSRTIIARLVSDLQALPELKISSVRRQLKQCVAEFNRLDDMFEFIETEEREAIYEALEQVVCAVRLPQLLEQIDQWRRW